MAVQRIDLNNRAVSMDAATVDRLVRLGSGDAALLYLYLLRCQGEYDPARAGAALHWSRGQLDTALAQLQELGLAAGAVLPRNDDPLPQPEQAPDYTAADIADELRDPTSQFPALVSEVERTFGKKLSNSQVSVLLELYDHVGLPAEVLMVMVNWLCQRSRKKYGTARNPAISVIKRTGYQWKERGYDTLEAADEYIKSVALRDTQEGAMLAALGIYGRTPVTSERQFIRQWIDWGFPPETVAVAYDITVTSIGKMNWNYCNGILKRWHDKGLHTPQQVEAERRQPADRQQQPGRSWTPPAQSDKPPAPVSPEEERRNQEKFLEMQRLLARMKGNQEG